MCARGRRARAVARARNHAAGGLWGKGKSLRWGTGGGAGGGVGVNENIAEREHGGVVGVVDRRRAAAYVGVTAGRFEQLVRDNVVPPPVMVDNKRRWPVALLDVAKEAVGSTIPCLLASVD